VRWTRYRRWNLIITGMLVLLLAAWVFGPRFGLSVPPVVFGVVVAVLIVANVALLVSTFRGMKADAARVVASHPGSAAFPTGLLSWPGSDRATRAGVIAVVADRTGLSFRDDTDAEVLLVPADHIMSLELAPLVPRSPYRPLRATTIEGSVIDFAGPSKPDEQVDAVVALREALGRATG
jgi:hypothetical protein